MPGALATSASGSFFHRATIEGSSVERIGRPPHFVSVLLLGTLSWEIGASPPLAPARSGQTNPRSIDRVLIDAR